MVTLKEMGSMVEARMPFKGNSVFASWVGDLYCVFSYGQHFPMYIFDAKSCVYGVNGEVLSKGLWLGNTDKYSTTTSRHQSKCRPREIHKHLNTEQMKDVIHEGSFVRHVVFRGEPLAA